MRIFTTSIAIFFSSIFFVTALTSCSGTRHIPKGSYLLERNSVDLKAKIDWKRIKRNIEDNRSLKEQLQGLAKQKPNKVTLNIFKFNLFVYNFFYTYKLNRTRQWLMNTIGEPPVIYDSTLVENSAKQMQTFLHNKGYFNSTVGYETKLHSKSAVVHYIVTPGTLYTVGQISFPSVTNGVTSIVNEFRGQTLLQTGAPLDFDKLDEERTRILRDLQNWGYYKFNKNDIYFTLDTTGQNKQVLLTVNINAPADSASQEKYYIRSVSVFSDFNPDITETKILTDTLEFNNLLFIHQKLNLRPEVLNKVIFISPGQEYSRDKYDYSLSRISDLGVYNFVSIRYKETVKDSLDCSVYLTPAPLNTLSAEFEMNDIEDNLGSALRFSYLNRNLRQRATQFEASVNGGVQVPIVNTDSLLYTGGTSLNFYIPRFLFLPIGEKRLSRYFNEKTKISIGANLIQQSKVYSLANYNFLFGWDWKENRRKRHIVNPVFVTLVSAFNLSPSFKEQLNDDIFLAQSFSDLLITGANYNFIYSSQQPDKLTNYSFLKTGVEISGHLFYGVEKLLDAFGAKTSQNDNGQYTLFDLPFSNYTRLDVDFRRFWLFDKNRRLVTRLYAGTGVPYLNSIVLPYIKQFYAGGPNDIRAWRIRALGPGSYKYQMQNNGYFNQTGDIKLQGNLEYRFGIFNFFKGALFMDAGNIWNIEKDLQKPGAEFQFNRFYKEIALGGGIGVRMDFDFMVLRFDFAVPLHDPSQTEGAERWTVTHPGFGSWQWLKTNTVLNIAVGYPFN